MKTILFMILMIQTTYCKADMLSDLFNSIYTPVYNYDKIPSEVVNESNELGEDHGLDNGEHYSWDNIYLCQYCDIEVISDPYGDSQSDY